MDISDLTQRVIEAQRVVSRLVATLPEAAYAEPSRLPGWTRAHVIAHLIGNAQAQTRQVDYALRGEQIEVYTGGQEHRDSEIERRCRLGADALTEQLDAAHSAFEVAASQVSDEAAARPVAYRSGTVRTVIDGRWMECLVHAVDLDSAGYTWSDWDADFCRVLIGYLLVRLPADRAVRLVATDTGDVFEHGSGAIAQAAAPVAAIAAYLSDRGRPELLDVAMGPYPRGSIAGR